MTASTAALASAPHHHHASSNAATSVRALYHVTAEAEPGLLARLLDPFAKMNLVLQRVHASAEDGDGSRHSIDLRLASVSQRDAQLVDKMLRRIVGVHQVITVLEPR